MKQTKPLSETHPKLAEEWSDRNFPFTPEDEYAGSADHVWWLGACGHEWYASVQTRTRDGARHGSGCPYCTGRAVLKGFNDFETLCPETAKEWDYEKNAPFTPDMFTKNSSHRAAWVCGEGHEWVTSISNRAKGNGCPVCARKPVTPGVNDLATTHPEIAAEWSEKNLPLTPDAVSAEYRKQVIWKCKICGNEYECQPYSRTHNRSICPFCRKSLCAEPAPKTTNKAVKEKAVGHQDEEIRVPKALPLIAEDEICEDLKTGVRYFGQGKYRKHSSNISDIAETPVCDRYALTVEEASSYFSIGIYLFRNIVKKNPDAPFLFHEHGQVFVIREKFEAFLNSLNKLPEDMT